MADRALTPDQVAILAQLQANPDGGLLSCHMMPGRRAKWCLPKLQSLQRRGYVERHALNVERWLVTSAGRAVNLSSAELAHG